MEEKWLNSSHIRRYVEEFRKYQTKEPPPPWRFVATHATWGLTDIGYGENSDYLLVISSQGRGVFDCLTGERVARERSEPDKGYSWYNSTKLTAVGIGPLEGQIIRVAGIIGGGLLTVTEDYWSLELVSPNWPYVSVILVQPHKEIYIDSSYGTKVFGQIGITAYGFSETGRSFVIATSSDIHIFARF